MAGATARDAGRRGRRRAIALAGTALQVLTAATAGARAPGPQAEEGAPPPGMPPAPPAPPANAAISTALSRTRSLFVTVQRDWLTDAEDGVAGGVEWLGLLGTPSAAGTGSTLLNLGAYAHGIGGNRWAFARAGLTRTGPRCTGRAGLDLGRGRDRAFPYRDASVQLTWTAAPGRLWLDVGERYLHIDTTLGNLVRAGLTARASRRATASVFWDRSTGGNIGASYVTARVDHVGSRNRWLGGVAYGTNRPETIGAGVGSAAATHTREAFAGVGLGMAGSETSVIVDAARFGDVTRITVMSVLRLKL